jgi:hypothetical protein
MAEPGAPDATAAAGWIGGPLSDLEGERIGAVEGLYIDAKNHHPAWVVARLNPTKRRDRGRVVAIPAGVCAGAPGVGVWIAEDGEMLRAAPVVDPGRALLREHELTILGHYGIAGEVGRAGEIADRDDGDVTAIPPRR